MENSELDLKKKISLLLMLSSLSSGILFLEIPPYAKWTWLGLVFIMLFAWRIKSRTRKVDERDLYIAQVSAWLAGNTAMTALALYIAYNGMRHTYTDPRYYILLTVWSVAFLVIHILLR